MKDKDIIDYVKANRSKLRSHIVNDIDNGLNTMLVHLTGKNAFKRPNWFNENTFTYDATKIKDKILAEFDAKPGQYGYGILLGKQPAGFYLLCIDIDIDGECKDDALQYLEKVFQKYKISYAKETTKSGRYHVYVAVDDLSDTLKNTKKLKYREDCIKYKGVKEVKGEIELLGASKPHMATIYSGVINDEKININSISINAKEILDLALLEFQSPFIEPEDEEFEEIEETKETKETEDKEFDIDILVEFFKLVRKCNHVDGWDIEKTVSAICVNKKVPDDDIRRIFEEIYQDEYDEKRTDYIIERTKEKDPQYLPTVARVITYAKKLATDTRLDEEEKKFLSDFIASFKKYTIHDYLLDAEKVYLIDSIEKKSKNKLTYYREWWFIERKIGRAIKVWYVEIETLYPKDIYKPHKVVGRPRFIGIKIEIRKLVADGRSRVYEVIINDDNNRVFRPSFDFQRLEDIAIEIAKKCSDLIGRFDIPLFQDYISIKLDEFSAKYGDNPPTCIISRNTGWDEDFTLFFHYELDDEKHELHRDHILYRHGKAKSIQPDGQHKLVFDLLTEGRLLGILIAISAASILLKPLKLQPLTCIIAGSSGVGKTTAAHIATSLFYKSDSILINANATNVGIELTLASLHSMPVTIDEGALAGNGMSLKHTIFSVASGKGKTRGKKDLSIDIKDLYSNVFWTTEVTDVDEVKRTGAYRRILYITVEKWEQFTKLFDVKQERPNEVFAGCGVDYIRYVMNSDTFRIKHNSMYNIFANSEISAIARTLRAGIILLEDFYRWYYKLKHFEGFTALRATEKALLKNVENMFVASRDDVVFALQQYLYSNLYRIGKLEVEKDENGRTRMKGDGTPVYKVTRPNTEALGEYDMFTQTFYITLEGFKKIAKELEKERSILENALANAGVMRKGENSRYSRVLGRNMRFYEIKFNDLPSEPSQDEKLDIPF